MAFLFGIRSQGQIISCITKEITCSAVQILSTEQRQRRRRRALSLVSCIKSKRKRRQSACNIFFFSAHLPPSSCTSGAQNPNHLYLQGLFSRNEEISRH